MKVLIVSTNDFGGAANACKRLHLGLQLDGVSSQMLVRNKRNNLPKCNVFVPKKSRYTVGEIRRKLFNRILKQTKLFVNKEFLFIRSRSKGLELFSFPNSNCDLTNSDHFRDADIINLHWVADFLDFKSFFNKNKKPVVWTLHDMNPFTGGEHYQESFLGIDQFGFPIERLLSNDEKLIESKNLKLKKKILSKTSSLTIVAPSKWLVDEARKSRLFINSQIHHIPYGLDSAIYSPKDMISSRDLFKLPHDKKIILFVAESISNNRKGFVFLQRAFEKLNDSNIVLCAVGNKSTKVVSSANFVALGSINDEVTMSAAYSAADVFVIPSLMDNLPNTVLESLLCGTPVIGFPVGGIREMIQDGVNGYLAEEISVDSLVTVLQKFLNTSDNFNWSAIRSDAVAKYDQRVQSQKYIDLFSSILETTSGVKKK